MQHIDRYLHTSLLIIKLIKSNDNNNDNDSNTYKYHISIEAMLVSCIFNGNCVSNNITHKPVIHLALQIVYTTTYAILEYLL